MHRVLTLVLCGLFLIFPLFASADGGGSNGGRGSSDSQREQGDKESQVQANYNEGYRLVQAGKYKDAIKAFKKVLIDDSRHAMAYTNMAYSYRKLGQHQEAIKLYEKALALAPNLPEAHEYIGEAFVAMGRIEDAERHLAILEKLDAKLAEELRADIVRQKRS